MADNERKQLSRRAVLKGAALIAGLAPLVQVRSAAAAGTVPKAAMKYQDHPNGKQDCSNCVQFIPGKTPAAMGECKVVAGSISPHGWCVAYTAKS
ncbi:MAG: high-potential iron-sulfur protein [Betaproteobacteria bacterium]|nr:high-potential iron-sulfur protein [Betaproteobacteria bacterium]